MKIQPTIRRDGVYLVWRAPGRKAPYSAEELAELIEALIDIKDVLDARVEHALTPDAEHPSCRPNS